jgi:hypothetical protein
VVFCRILDETFIKSQCARSDAERALATGLQILQVCPGENSLLDRPGFFNSGVNKMLSTRSFKIAPFVLAAIFTTACAHKPAEAEKKAEAEAAAVAPKPVKTVEAAKEVASKNFVMVNFAPGKYTLSESDKRALAEWSVNAPKKGKVAKYEILAWADKEYPADGKNVAKKDIHLADERAKAVEEFFKKDLITKADLKRHNMAKRPGVFSEIFKTDDYEVKEVFEDRGAAPTEHHVVNLKEENKASKAVVLVKYE